MNNIYKNILAEMNDELKKFDLVSNSLSGYEYEKQFRVITDKYNQKLFQASQGKVPKSKNEKHHIQTSYGKIVVKKRSSLESTSYGV